MSSKELASLQTNLLKEASYLTRTLYRKCLKSVRVLAAGNARDESDFSERENSELDQFGEDGVNLDRISMAPPVNRQNELASRANYYKAFAREHFDGHWNLLGAHGFHIGKEGNMSHGLGAAGGRGGDWNQYQGGHHHLGSQMGAQCGQGDALRESAAKGEPQLWREEQVQQFIYLLRSGEEKRRWILSDYEFNDPCNCTKEDGAEESHGWPDELEERLTAFEEQSNSLVREMYRRKGWMHSSGHGQSKSDEDDFFSDSDSD
ncbi:hypothetical protein ACHAXT_012306 [Thalassiosira profunda]